MNINDYLGDLLNDKLIITIKIRCFDFRINKQIQQFLNYEVYHINKNMDFKSDIDVQVLKNYLYNIRLDVLLHISFESNYQKRNNNFNRIANCLYDKVSADSIEKKKLVYDCLWKYTHYLYCLYKKELPEQIKFIVCYIMCELMHM